MPVIPSNARASVNLTRFLARHIPVSRRRCGQPFRYPVCTMSVSTSATISDSRGRLTSTEMTPQEFLQNYPDAAYTTMYVQGGEVFDLELHLQRLSRWAISV